MLSMVLALSMAQTTPVPSYRQATNVSIITIHGVVDSVTAQSFKRRLAEASNADAIVIDLNTPGGDLMSTLEICYEIKNNAQKNTVAWIHPHAFSAGTIIALACREIVVVPGATFGDAAPINVTGQPIPVTERAKIESPVLTEVIDSARRNHYDEHLVEAFVSVGIELWLLENTETGETVCVNASEYESLYGTSPPRNFSPISANSDAASAISPLFDSISRFTKELQPQPVNWDPTFTQQLPSSRPQLNSKDAPYWKLVREIVPNDRLLTLKPPEAARYGLISGVIANDKELKDWFGATSIRLHTPNWAEGLVRIMVSWPIRLILIAIFLVCVFVEFVTGSTGVFSAAAVISMGLLIGAPWLAGLAQWWDIVLVLLGLVLVGVEIFVIPGTGFTGFAGVGCLFTGMIGSFVSGDLRSQEGQAQLFTGLGSVLGGCILAIVAAWLIAKHLESGPAMRKIVLEDEVHGHTRKQNPTPMIDTVAIAITDLRPSGRIEVDNQIFDATTTGSWVSKGATVRIMHTGLTIEVEEIQT